MIGMTWKAEVVIGGNMNRGKQKETEEWPDGRDPIQMVELQWVGGSAWVILSGVEEWEKYSKMEGQQGMASGGMSINSKNGKAKLQIAEFVPSKP